MAGEKVQIIIEGVDNASGPIKNIGKAIGDLEGQGSKTGGILAGLGGTISKLGVAAAGAVVGGVVLLAAGLGDCLREAMNAEKVMADTNATLKSTGGVAGMTAESVSKLALSLSEVTPFEDEVIQRGENMLLTFTNIGKDVFPMATEAMLNMSQKMGGDVKESAIQLGKALQDPVKGITALQRVGVTFTADQKELIKSLVATGDVAGAQKVILAELEKEFGGVARAAGDTLSGKLTILNNQFGNIKESIGTALIPVLSEFLEKYGPQLIQFAQDAAKWIITSLIPALVDIATWLGTNLPPVINWIANSWNTVLLPAFQAVSNFIQTNVVPVLKELQLTFGVYLPASIATIKAWIDGTLIPAWETFREKIQPAVDIVVKIVDFLKVKVPEAITSFKTFLSTVVIPNPFAGLLAAIQSVIDKVATALAAIASLAGGVAGAVGAVGTGAAGYDPVGAALRGLVGGRQHAAGTMFAPGGLSLVGERGPELVNLPRGSQVYPMGGGNWSGLAQALAAQPIIVQIDGERIATVVRSRLQLRGAGGLGW